MVVNFCPFVLIFPHLQLLDFLLDGNLFLVVIIDVASCNERFDWIGSVV